MGRTWTRWAACWNSDGLDGPKEHIIGHLGMPALFKTRREARAFIAEHYGYIKNRPDLRAWPHGWRLPVPKRVTIAIIQEPRP